MSLIRYCKKKLTDDITRMQRLDIETWPSPGSPEWLEGACLKNQVSGGAWLIIEDALDLRRGVLMCEGGKGAQEHRWWTLVKYAEARLSAYEVELKRRLQAESSSSDKNSGARSLIPQGWKNRRRRR